MNVHTCGIAAGYIGLFDCFKIKMFKTVRWCPVTFTTK